MHTDGTVFITEYDLSPNKHQAQNGIQRSLWEVFSSLHLAFAGISSALVVSDVMSGLTGRMEVRINNYLHISQTDFIRGYFGIWIPTLITAFLIWILLRTFHRNRYVEEFLRSLAGVITLFAPAIFWIVVYETMSWSYEGLYTSVLIDISAVLVCALLLLSRRWMIPIWAGVILLVAHYAFWYITQSGEPSRASYLGPFGPALGFCSAAVWFLYVKHVGNVKSLDTPATIPKS